MWTFATGIFKIVASIQLRKIMKTDWLLIVSGIASLILGVLLAIQPAAGAMVLLWLIGAYAIILGVFLLFRAF